MCHELKKSRLKDDKRHKSEIVQSVKNQRQYRAQSMEGCQRNKMRLAQSVKEHKSINIRRMEDSTVDCIHSLIDMKEKSEIDRELARQR